MTRHHEAIKVYREEYPAFNSYIECMTRASMKSMTAFALGFGSSYFGQKLLTKQLPYSNNGVILVSSGAACALAYYAISTESKTCQNAWMAQEEKHTALNPILEKETE